MLLHEDLTDKIIGIFYDVYNELGYGFLEKVYQNALYIALKEAGFKVEPQRQIKVVFRGIEVGEYFSDLVVNDLIILELKAEEAIHSKHERQLLNYLRSTHFEVGLLLNFGELPKFKRKIYSNENKPNFKRKS
jgi:GxxExxY protein